MTTETKEPELISASQVSRRANVPLGKLLRAIRAGAIQPNLTCMDPRLFLFDANRVDEVKTRLITVEKTTAESLIPA